MNRSQRKRGTAFVKAVRTVAREVLFVDEQELKLGATTIHFSPAVPHGKEGTFLGSVVMTAIRHREVTVVHASDVQGPIEADTTDWILAQNPQLVILAGPPTYLVPERISPALISQAADNLTRLTSQIPTIIVDHHLQRDPSWREWLAPIQVSAHSRGHQVVTVADALGLPEQMLETQRSELYSTNPISPDYEAWIRTIKRGRIATPPPFEH